MPEPRGQDFPGNPLRPSLRTLRRRIERVAVSLDRGETFLTAELLDGGEAGSWCLWKADLEVGAGPGELVVRAGTLRQARSPRILQGSGTSRGTSTTRGTRSGSRPAAGLPKSRHLNVSGMRRT